jgi:hypothetical protein
MNPPERADCDRLAHYIKLTLPAPERFNRFDGPDSAGPESDM